MIYFRIISLIFLLSFISMVQAQSKLDKSYEKIKNAFVLRDHSKVIKLCNKNIQKNPYDITSIAMRGSSYTAIERYRKSNLDFILLDSLMPNNKITQLKIGYNFVYLKVHDTAITYLERAMVLGYKPDVDFYFTLGSAYYFNRQNNQAINYLKKGLAIDSTYSSIYNNLAWASLDSNPAYSCKIFHKAYQLDTTNPVNINNLGYSHLLCGNLETAFSYFKRAEKLQPENSFIHRNIGLYYMKMGQKEEARKYLNKAIDLNIVGQWGEHYITELRKYCTED